MSEFVLKNSVLGIIPVFPALVVVATFEVFPSTTIGVALVIEFSTLEAILAALVGVTRLVVRPAREVSVALTLPSNEHRWSLIADNLLRMSEFTDCWSTVVEALAVDWEGWATDTPVAAASPTCFFLQFLPTGLEC